MENKKVLVVDDEHFISRSLSFMLKKEGYDCLTAGDGVEAMEVVRGEKPDLIFLDINMPKKDGYAVCKEIKEDAELKDIYIIMLTAKGQEADKEKGLALGANEFMLKPFDPRLVRERVKEIFEGE